MAIAVSDASGTYHFSNVPPGTYYVEVFPPALSTVTTQDAGSDDTVDSDVDPETLTTAVFAVADKRLDIDCGFALGGGS